MIILTILAVIPGGCKRKNIYKNSYAPLILLQSRNPSCISQ